MPFGLPDLEPVTIALDDPMRVSRDAQTADPPFWKFVVCVRQTDGHAADG